MKLTKSVFAAFLFMLASDISAQSLGDAMKLLEMKQYNKAKSAFLINMDKNISVSDLYYLGKIYSIQHQIDSAKIYFSKIESADSKNPLSLVAQAIIETVSGNYSQALLILDKANRLAVSIKDINSLAEIAFIRYQAGDTAGWIIPLSLATSFDRKNTKPYITAGEIYQLLGEKYKKQNYFIGFASGRYEQALYIEPENMEALTNQANIFIFGGNYSEATEYLDKIISTDSNYIPALRAYGDLAYTLGKYDKASLYYSRYITLAEYNDKELSRFITILYFNKEYAKANELITPVLKKEPSNAVMLRLKGYSAYELGKYPEGLDAMKRFFDLRSATDTNKIIPSDYEYTGKLFSRNGNDSLSIIYLKKAIEMDSSKSVLFEDIAKTYEKQKKYQLAVENYNKFIETRKGNVASAIHFSKGKDLLALANDEASVSDSIQRRFYLQLADTAFSKVIELSPNSHLGYQWHARVLAALDPETILGLAKADYEKTLSILELKTDLAKYKSDRIEVYRYLGYYYYQQYDAAKTTKDLKEADQAKVDAVIYWKNVLELDPENDIAKQAINALK